MQKKKRKFGLFEASFVIIGVALLGLIGTPFAVRHIEQGRQAVRDEVVITLYQAAQERLTELHSQDGFEEMIAEYIAEAHQNEEDRREQRRDWLLRHHTAKGLPEDEFEEEELGEFTLLVYDLLLSEEGEAPAGVYLEERENVIYVSKTGRTVPRGLMNLLLDPDVVDVEDGVLNNPVLIEFNVKTGVILSIVYGDRPDQWSGFVYIGDSTNSVLGSRDPSEYAHVAKRRSQGYIGVEAAR
jgi:hypothetical protein